MLLSFGNIGASIVGGLLSGITSIIGANKQAKEAQKNRDFQSNEARLNREFNADQAQISRDFQLEMFNRTNQYNDPSQVVQRLVKAGLHPALAFGGIQGASFGGSAAQASSSASPSGSVADMSGITSMGNNIVNAASSAKVAEAQANYYNSEAEKNRKETSWIDRLKSSEEQKNLSGVLVDLSTSNLNNEEAKNAIKLREQIGATIDNLKADTDFKTINHSLIAKEVDWFDIVKNQQMAESVAKVQSFFASADLSKIQAYRLSVLLSSEVLKNESTANFLNSAADNQSAQAIESGQRRGLYAFNNALNQAKLKEYGLDKLSQQQFREIESKIRNLDADSSYKIGMMVNESIGNIFDVTKEGFEIYKTFKRRPVGFR